MSAHIRLSGIKIIPVSLRRASRVGDIMDDNIVYPLHFPTGSRMTILLDKVLLYIGRIVQTGYIHSHHAGTKNQHQK